MPSEKYNSKRKAFLFSVLCSLLVYALPAQQESQVESNYGMASDTNYTAPQFKGGMKRLNSIITENMVYPKAAWKDGAGGQVIVGFDVDTSGQLSDIHILQGVRADIDTEALRLVRLLRKWTPGQIDGKPVRVRYQLPLTFIPNKFRVKEKNPMLKE